MNLIKKILLVVFLFSIASSGLVNPENDQTVSYVYIPFEWEQEANAASYNLQVSESAMFTTLLLDVVVNSTLYIEKNVVDWEEFYYWRVRPVYSDETVGDWVGSFSFNVSESHFENLEINIYNDDMVEDGLVEFAGFGPVLQSAVIDVNGREIWNDNASMFMVNHVNEYGNIFGFGVSDYPNNTGAKINYNNEVLWNAPEGIPVDIHEVKQIPNGNYMAFVPKYSQGPIPPGEWSFYFQLFGYEADGETIEFPWMGMRIVEWNEEGDEIWDWDPFEHFSMDDSDLYGGTWWNAIEEGSFDWMHSNAFHFDEEESVIYVSHRHLSRISKIAYPSGDVLWNIGMPEGYNTGDNNICTNLGISFQHNIQLLDDGSLLLFDNGNLSQMLMGDEYPTTRIRRFHVIDDSYCEPVWEYELSPELFALGMGSVQLLNNGNYFIYTFGSGLGEANCSILEVTPDFEVVWKYSAEENVALYRSYKIPSLHPDAFSVTVDNFIFDDLSDFSYVEILNSSIEFNVENHSGYTQIYQYSFDDIDDDLGMFDLMQGEVTIDPYGSFDLSFMINDLDILTSEVHLSIWPKYHDYSNKEYTFNVEAISNVIGDINFDGNVNVLDVVSLVNIILGYDDEISAADLNEDGTINVIDVVLLVNLILY